MVAVVVVVVVGGVSWLMNGWFFNEPVTYVPTYLLRRASIRFNEPVNAPSWDPCLPVRVRSMSKMHKQASG